MTTTKVKDGQRILEFDGEEIGFSSSQRRDSFRWIEFRLYKTKSGKYILSRIGFSNLYHLPDCEIAERSKLDESTRDEILDTDYPCPECRPDLDLLPFVCFEREKHWARVYASADEVLGGLMKTDISSGIKYMTAVARRLLEDAATVDDAIEQAQSTERID